MNLKKKNGNNRSNELNQHSIPNFHNLSGSYVDIDYIRYIYLEATVQ